MMYDFHPLIIHFPIALFSTSVLFELIYFYTKRKDIGDTSWWIMLTAIISSIPAIITGIIDDLLIGHFLAVWPIWNNHGALQLISITGFTILFYIKTSNPSSYNKYQIQYILISFIIVAIFFYGAHLGALLSGRI